MLVRSFMRLFLFVFILPLVAYGVWWTAQPHAANWSSADWSSARLLPSAGSQPAASVTVFAAPTGRWKGVFAVHSWLVIKEAGAAKYTRYDVAGWGAPVKVDEWAPDGRWFSNVPRVVGQVTGPDAERLIPRIRKAVAAYPARKPGDYRLYPGPNSNTFIAAVLAEVPEAGIILPPNAVGRDWRGVSGLYAGASPSRTGVQVSLFGLFGVTVGRIEGFELNLFGLVAGFDWQHLTLKLPGWGNVPLRGGWS
jgi:Protein of unknown function (DUF3750)